MNESFKNFLNMIPETDEKIDWDLFENSFLKPTIEAFKNTHQRLDYHGEDDVWTHTKMVTEALMELPQYKQLDRELQKILFTAAFFHDLGKIYTTVKENGEWTSPYHASVGAEKFRELFQNEFEIDENSDEKVFEDTVALLIANHIKPMHTHQKRNPKKEFEKLAENKTISPLFNLELLSLLVEADMRGRISKDTEKKVKTIDRFRREAEKYGLLK